MTRSVLLIGIVIVGACDREANTDINPPELPGDSASFCEAYLAKSEWEILFGLWEEGVGRDTIQINSDGEIDYVHADLELFGSGSGLPRGKIARYASSGRMGEKQLEEIRYHICKVVDKYSGSYSRVPEISDGYQVGITFRSHEFTRLIWFDNLNPKEVKELQHVLMESAQIIRDAAEEPVDDEYWEL